MLGGIGVGLSVEGTSFAQILGNTVYGNGGTSFGAGIGLDDASNPTIENNFIYSNAALEGGPGEGGGIWIVNDSEAIIVQNLIVANHAPQGGGIYFLVPEGSMGPLLVNNTIVGAKGTVEGSAVWAAGYDNLSQFFNNIMVSLDGKSAVWCDRTYSQEPPTFTNNDAWSAHGVGLKGTCAMESQQDGNLNVNPSFVGPFARNFQLQSNSAMINAGDNSSPDLPTTDLAGNPRIVGGVVDMGAYEYQGNDKAVSH